ncbi:MAG TPA: hypothetical protein VNJ08_03760 [Bacteriovoracaceae bacterium]|nr:hypothetical protein [Bacteriovoracaceae bacterium]
MPRLSNNKAAKKNSTEERLRATPFDSVEELDTETASIRLAVWRRVTEGKIIDELLSKPESKYLLDEWKAGLLCFFGNDSKNSIYRIYSEGQGLKLQLNKEFAKSLAEHEVTFLEGVVRAGIEGYGALYMRSKSIIQSSDVQSSKKTDNLSKKTKS